MPHSKKDDPTAVRATDAQGNIKRVTDADDSATKDAVEDALDAGAGAPEAMREAAEDLPENDKVQQKIKEAMLATDAQTEAEAKAVVVDESPNAAETPSGAALKATAGISDDIKRGEEYTRIKSAVRHGYVPADEADLKANK